MRFAAGSSLGYGEPSIGDLETNRKRVDFGGVAIAVGVFEEEWPVTNEHGDVFAGQGASAEGEVSFDADEVCDDQVYACAEDVDEWSVDIGDFRHCQPRLA